MALSFEKMSPRSRRNTLAVGMLGVLAVSTVVAWAIAAVRSGERPGESWYVSLNAQGEPAGWSVLRHHQAKRDLAEGYSVQYYGPPTGPALIDWNAWALNTAKQQGVQGAGISQAANNRLKLRSATKTLLEGSTVTVQKVVDRNRRLVQKFNAGPDFIATGRFQPTLIEVAQTGRTIVAVMVDETTGTPVQVSIENEGRKARKTQQGSMNLSVVTVRGLVRQGRRATLRYYVADNGSIPIIETLDNAGRLVSTAQMVDVQTVRNLYPSAHLLRNRILTDAGKL